MFDLPILQELTIGSIRYKIGIDRATTTEYGGIKARLIPKDSEQDAVEVYIGRNGRLYLPAESISQNEDIISEYNSSTEFPIPGEPNTLYIDTTTNTAYRFSTSDSKYYSVSGIKLGSEIMDELSKALTITEAIINGNANKISITA